MEHIKFFTMIPEISLRWCQLPVFTQAYAIPGNISMYGASILTHSYIQPTNKTTSNFITY
jgi:hypothetical protein